MGKTEACVIREKGQEVYLAKVGDRLKIDVNFVGEDGLLEGGVTFGIPLKKIEGFFIDSPSGEKGKE